MPEARWYKGTVTIELRVSTAADNDSEHITQAVSKALRAITVKTPPDRDVKDVRIANVQVSRE